MWNNITSGFDVDNETANFGTRAVAESEVAVFETNTLATIQAENQNSLSPAPSICTEYYPELCCCLLIDNSVALFNENCSKTLLSLTFDTKVDAGCIVDGKFLLIGLDTGELHFYHVPTQTRIFTKSFNKIKKQFDSFLKTEFNGIENSASNSERVFVKIKQRKGDIVEIFIITAMGHVYRMRMLKLEQLETACENRDKNTIEELAENIICNEMFEGVPHKFKITLACLPEVDMDDTNSFLLIGKDIYFLSEDDNCIETCLLSKLEQLDLKKIEVTQNKSLCFGLTETGKLAVFCMHTLMVICVWDDFPVLDFTLLDGLDGENNLLIITGGEAYMMLLSWPGFQVKFKLQVQPNSYLVNNQRGSEDILYIEGFGEEIIDTVRLKAVVESQPEFRLQRILSKGRFEEAEKFARTFNLDLELVYRAQVQRLIQELQPWNTNLESLKVAFDKFMTLLEKITDIEFVSECCINAIPPDLKTTQMLLEYGRSRLSKLPVKSESYVRSDLLQKFSSISQRLITYQQMYGSTGTAESWFYFLKANLFKECQKHLKRGEIRESVLIWSRHLYEIKATLNWNQALLLLEEDIPTWVKAKDIALWLHHFVPPILSIHPDVPQYISEWTIGKIKTFEVSERESWPEVGLELAHNMLRILEVPFVGHSLLKLQDNTLLNNQSPKSPVNKLLAFIKNLQDMQTLKNNYGVVISCIDFLQLNDQDLMTLILKRTPIEKLKSLMTGFLKKIIHERNLVSDMVVSHFIQELLCNSVHWLHFDEAPWEMSIAALIPCVHDIQERLVSVLRVLQIAPVPWSGLITQLAEDALKLKHPLVNEIQECINILPQKLIYKKYGVQQNFPKTDKSANLVIKHILVQNRDSALQDVLKLAEFTEEKSFSYQIILKQFIEKGDYGAALEVLAILDPEVMAACKDFIMNAAKQHLKLENLEQVKHYVEFLPVICSEDEWSPFKKYYLLKVNKNVNFHLEDFWYKDAKDKRLRDHTAVILKGLLENQLTEEEVKSRIPHYAYLLDVSHQEWVVSIASQAVTCNFSLALSFSSEIKDLGQLSDDAYSKVLTLVVSQFSHHKPRSDNTTEDMVNSMCNLATQTVIHCSPNYVGKAVEIFSWFGLLKRTRGVQKNVFSNIYTDPSPSISTVMNVHSVVKTMFQHYISARCNSHLKLDSRELEAFKSTMDNSLLEDFITLKLPSICGQLRSEQQNMACVSLLSSFHWFLSSLHVPFEAKNIELVLDQCIFELLMKLSNSRHFDLPSALSFLLYFDENAPLKLTELEKSVSYNYQRLMSVSLLGLTFCRINGVDASWKYYNKKHTQCVWAKKLSDLGIPYKEAFKENDADHKKQLLFKLMKTTGVNLDLLKEYCFSMRVHFQECLEIYLEEIILSWEPNIQFKINCSGNKEMVVKDTVAELKKQCLDIIFLIESDTKVLIKSTLESLWNKINFYYYEVFIVVIELVEKLTEIKNDEFSHYKLLLGFLRSYIRISEPQLEEKENWFQLRPSTQSLPPIAEFRLPFTMLLVGDPWKLIKPELNLTTYKMWFEVISSLHLDKNTLCFLTIHRLTSNQLNAGDSIEDSTEWYIHLRNKSLLAEIKDCVANITNLEMASASLYYVVNHMPPGADQVAAAELCYIEAQKWVSLENTDKAQKGLAKVEKKYLMVSTSHILHTCQLGQPKYLQLVLKPDELISELYQDPIILKRQSSTTNLPDINRAVDAIAKLYGLDVVNIRFEILSEWLQTGNMSLDTSVEDATSNVAVAMYHQRNDYVLEAENENLMRACYLLESVDRMIAAKYLSALAFGTDEYRNVHVKLQALQCLCAVTSRNMIELVTARTLTEIRKYMQTLLFEQELEKLGVPWLSEKSEIVRALLKRSSPHALRIAAAICTEFNLNSPEYWDRILARMVDFEMVEVLCLVLPDLTPYSHLINSEVFKNAWNYVILTPLAKAVYPMDEEGQRKVDKSLEMLHKCPILPETDIALIKEHCDRLRVKDVLISFFM